MKEPRVITSVTISLHINKKNDEMRVRIMDNKSINKIKEISPHKLYDIKKQIEKMAEQLFDSKTIKKG